MVVEHNSRSTIYRSPFGAVPCLSRIILRLFAKTDEIPRSVSLIYRFKDEELIKLPMTLSSNSCGSLEAITRSRYARLLYYFKLRRTPNLLLWEQREALGIGRMYEDVFEYQVTVLGTIRQIGQRSVVIRYSLTVLRGDMEL